MEKPINKATAIITNALNTYYPLEDGGFQGLSYSRQAF